MNTSLLDQIYLIQESEELAGIDVMASLADTYMKRMMILEQCDETSDLYQEAAEGEDVPEPTTDANKQSFIDKAKNSKPGQFVVKILRIVVNFLKRIPVLIKKAGLKVYAKKIYGKLKTNFGNSNELPLLPHIKSVSLGHIYEILRQTEEMATENKDDKLDNLSDFFEKLDSFANAFNTDNDKIDFNKYYESMEFRGNLENVARLIASYVNITDILAEDATYLNRKIEVAIKYWSEYAEKDSIPRNINVELWRRGSENAVKACAIVLRDFKAYIQALSRYMEEHKNVSSEETDETSES